MSARQLKKLRQWQEQAELEKRLGESGEKEESENETQLSAVAAKSRSAFSGFAALAMATGEEDDDTEEEQEANPPSPPRETAPQPTSSKKKKKKAKKAKKQDPQLREAEANNLDEIDRAIQELGLARPVVQSQQNITPSDHVDKLLQINFQHLKAINEMRKMFGKNIMRSAETERDTRQARPNRNRQAQVSLEEFLQAQPGKTLSDVMMRRNAFIEGKKTWPSETAHGLTMKRLSEENEGVTEFTFDHDQRYADLDQKFFHLIHMLDPMQIVHFLRYFPYHVSSLIQVSKVAMQDQNSALAADLCERALYTFGRVTLSAFRQKLEQGKARLDFYRPENRQFWLAGHNYIRALFQKGTVRTALEWTKLYVSVSHEDPYDFMNWIQILAIRASEAQWFLDLCDSALLSDIIQSQGNREYLKQTAVLARLQLNDKVGAKELLIRGMETLPWLYSSLFSALNLDVPRSIWGVQPRDPDEKVHTSLYIHLAKDLWNSPAAIALLKEAADAAKKVDLTTLPAPGRLSLATARFIYLDNTAALMSEVPRRMLHVQPNYDFDPLPPAHELNVFSHPNQVLPWGQSTGNINYERFSSHEQLNNILPGIIEGLDVPDEVREQLLRELAETDIDPSQRIHAHIPDGEGSGAASMPIPGAWNDEGDEYEPIASDEDNDDSEAELDREIAMIHAQQDAAHAAEDDDDDEEAYQQPGRH